MLKALWPKLRREWPTLVLSGLAIMVYAAANGAYAGLTGPALKMLFTGSMGLPFPQLAKFHLPTSAAWFLPAAIVVVAALKGFAQTVQFYSTGGLSQRIVRGLREELFAHLLQLSPRFFGKHNTADLLQRLTADGERVEQALFYGIVPLARETITVLVLLGSCIYIDPVLALFAFLVIPVSALPLVRFSKWLKRVSRKSQDQLADLSFTSFEALSGMRTVQAFTLEPFEKKRFEAAGIAHEHAMRRSYFIRGLRTPVMEVLGAGGAAALIAFMVRSVGRHTLEPAHVASFATAVLLMYDPVKKLGNVGDWLAQGEAAFDRMREVTQAPIEITSGVAQAPMHARGDLRIESVGFAYEDKAVLSDFTLHVEPGSVCALVGRSGAGKTTLMQLVLRFYDPSQGRIVLDGRDLREWSLADLRRTMAWVSQDIFLFNASVRDNLAAGEAYSDTQIEAALEAAFALEFVRELPQGLATVVGERGTTLSGGQRQRIAIARAFLRNTPLLLLDEATSALDTQSERMVQAALDRLMVDRTTLVIAHRLSTIERAAQIAVMEGGRIVQLGTHAELISREGEYRALAGHS